VYGSGTLSMARSFASRGRRVLCATLVLSRGDGWVLALQPFSQFPRGTVRWHQSRQVVHASATADAALQRNVPRLIPTPPEEAPDALRLLNSLTMKNEPFVPIDHVVKWYICGPTVYDSSHIGHARNYVAFDIVRRVMLDYFGFDIVYVMNITDIDDKIILRTHRNHLEKMLEALSVAADNTAVDEACRAAQQVLGAKEQSLPLLIEAQHALRAAAEDAGLEALDVCDVQVAFTELTAEFEREFLEDMAALNVLPPDAITRVSDYVPEIVAYIETILANGYCYEAVRSTAARTQTRGNRCQGPPYVAQNGSVYFDTAAFAAAGLRYGKLDPSKVGDTELIAEGEGALSSADTASEKRQPADFVLWKRSKQGEPEWESPWGKGRPGWHIECSAMASDVLGQRMDLNAGGADLKFPHHENQMAQAEAHYNCCGWVNYFLHSGHLQIEGRKMSKSLKNFVTIREVPFLP
jgi:cysteinyl-tRNA synthetase